MDPSVSIRSETLADVEAISLVNQAAFGQQGEAGLVNALRADRSLTISLVAELDGEIVGQITFSPMVVDQQPEEGMTALGLGPMAVLPAFQNQGIGLRLLEAGIQACRQQGAEIVMVLGHPKFYSKAGFQPASQFGIMCQYPASDEAFMVLELSAGKMQAYAGVARYHPAFDEVT
jgi:putative acetyltransferase